MWIGVAVTIVVVVVVSAPDADVGRGSWREEGERAEDLSRLPRRVPGQGQLHRRILAHHRRYLHPRVDHPARGHGLQTHGIQVSTYLEQKWGKRLLGIFFLSSYGDTSITKPNMSSRTGATSHLHCSSLSRNFFLEVEQHFYSQCNTKTLGEGNSEQSRFLPKNRILLFDIKVILPYIFPLNNWLKLRGKIIIFAIE